MSLALALAGLYSPAPVHAAAAGVTDRSAIGELNYWNSIKNSTDPQDVRSYLDAFPNGMFFDPATARYLLLTGQPSATPEKNSGAASSSARSPKAKSGKTVSSAGKSKAAKSNKKAAAARAAPGKKFKKQAAGSGRKNHDAVTAQKSSCKSGSGAKACAARIAPSRKRSVPAEGGGGGGGGGNNSGGGGWN